LIHEGVTIFLSVKELKFAAFYAHFSNGVATLKGMLDCLTAGGTFKFGPNLSTATAYLKALKINHPEGIVVQFDAKAVANICGRCHSFLIFE
jgi:hypothetical protein